jgi:hypothetical protein
MLYVHVVCHCGPICRSIDARLVPTDTYWRGSSRTTTTTRMDGPVMGAGPCFFHCFVSSSSSSSWLLLLLLPSSQQVQQGVMKVSILHNMVVVVIIKKVAAIVVMAAPLGQ